MGSRAGWPSGRVFRWSKSDHKQMIADSVIISKDNQMNRRELIRNIAAGTVTLFVVPTTFTSCEDDLPEPDDNNNPDDNI